MFLLWVRRSAAAWRGWGENHPEDLISKYGVTILHNNQDSGSELDSVGLKPCPLVATSVTLAIKPGPPPVSMALHREGICSSRELTDLLRACSGSEPDLHLPTTAQI